MNNDSSDVITGTALITRLVELPGCVWKNGKYTRTRRVILPIASVVCRFAPYYYDVEVQRPLRRRRGQHRGQNHETTVLLPVMRVCPLILQSTSTGSQ
jgi:hypothetical protein